MVPVNAIFVHVTPALVDLYNPSIVPAIIWLPLVGLMAMRLTSNHGEPLPGLNRLPGITVGVIKKALSLVLLPFILKIPLPYWHEANEVPAE